MHGGSDDGAGDEENCEDRRETSDGEESVQGSHRTHSRVSTRTLHPENGRCGPRVPTCLYLSCGKAECCLNLGLSVAGLRAAGLNSNRCRDGVLGGPGHHLEALGRCHFDGATCWRGLQRRSARSRQLQFDAANPSLRC